MTMDWQSTIVALSILGALVYVGKRGLKRLRTFGAAKAGSASCETGCGSCDGGTPASKTHVVTLVQINGSSAHPGQSGKV